MRFVQESLGVFLTSFAVAVILYIFFPDSPVQARWLSDQDKILAVKRVAEGKTGVKNTKFKMYQVRLTVRSLTS